MKNVIAVIMIALFLTAATTAPSYAGSKERDLAAGLIIGTGALMLGAAIADSWDDNHRGPEYRHKPYRPDYRPEPYRSHPRERRHAYRKGHKRGYNKGYRHGYHDGQRDTYMDKRILSKPAGYWTKKKRWVEPVYKLRWEKGQMNEYRRWTQGRYVKVLATPGHWEKEKVWVSYTSQLPYSPNYRHVQNDFLN